jgi:hypothetical protein
MELLANKLLHILPKERIKARLIDRYAYASDASHFYLVPQAVVQPISIEEVQKLFEFSHKEIYHSLFVLEEQVCRGKRLPMASSLI